MKLKNVFVAFLLLFLLGCSGKGDKVSEEGQPRSVRGVKVEAVRLAPVQDFFEATGTVRAERSTTLSSKIIGTITAVRVKEGDKIKRGETLVEIDGRDLQAQLQEARAGLEEVEYAVGAAGSSRVAAAGQKELAAATLKRYEALVARGSVTPQEYDEVSAKYKVADAESNRAEQNLRALRAKKVQAEARVASVKTLLSYTAIVSPYDGVVTAKTAEVGMLASPAVALLSVEESGRYRLEAQVGESQIQLVRVGASVPVTIGALPDRLTGTVAELVPAAEPQSRTFTVKLSLPLQPWMRSGLYGKARFPAGERKVIAVPSGALVRRGELVGVYTVDERGLARLRLVRTGKNYGDRVEVLAGLGDGERIVVAGVERVSEGSRPVP